MGMGGERERGGVRLGENGSIEREGERGGGGESRGREMKGSLRFRVTRDLAGVVRLFFFVFLGWGGKGKGVCVCGRGGGVKSRTMRISEKSGKNHII